MEKSFSCCWMLQASVLRQGLHVQQETGNRPVLLAMGLTAEEAQGSLRLTLSEDTTSEEIEQTADTLSKLIEGLNEF